VLAVYYFAPVRRENEFPISLRADCAALSVTKDIRDRNAIFLKRLLDGAMQIQEDFPCFNASNNVAFMAGEIYLGLIGTILIAT
jgi:hypothetical protein